MHCGADSGVLGSLLLLLLFSFFFFGLGFRVLAADGPAAAEQAEAPAEAPAGALWLTEGCVLVGVRGSGIRVSMQR